MLTKTNTLARCLGMGFVASVMSLTAGCGSSDDLDLSQLALATEDAAAEMSGGGLPFLWARPNPAELYCVRAPCPVYNISDVNLASDELTYAIDWRALQLTTEQQTDLSEHIGKVLMFGRYAVGKAFGEQVKVFQVTRASRRVSEQSIDSPDSDRYYTVQAGDPSCGQPPCQTIKATLMNRFQHEQWSGVDLSRLGLTPAGQQQLLTEMQNRTASVSARETRTLPVLSAAFRPYNAPPLP